MNINDPLVNTLRCKLLNCARGKPIELNKDESLYLLEALGKAIGILPEIDEIDALGQQIYRATHGIGGSE